MSRNRYLMIIAGLFLITGFLVLAYGKSAFPVAINPFSLLADAGELDYSGDTDFNPSPIDFSAPVQDANRNSAPAIQGSYSFPTYTGPNYWLPTYNSVGNPIDNVPWFDRATVGEGSSQFLGYSPTVSVENYSNQNTIPDNTDTQPIDLAERIGLGSGGQDVPTNYFYQEQLRPLGAPSVPVLYPGVVDWTIRPQQQAIQFGAPVDSDVPPEVRPVDILGRAREMINDDRKNAPFVESTVADPASNASAQFQGAPLRYSGSSSIRPILDKSDVPVASYSGEGSGQQQGLIRSAVTRTANYLLGENSLLSNLLNKVTCKRITGGAFCSYSTSY